MLTPREALWASVGAGAGALAAYFATHRAGGLDDTPKTDKKEVKPKLTYFDIWGKGEIARLIAAYGAIEVEETRVGMKEWPALKESGISPTGQLPVLEIGGTKITQSQAIARFLAKGADLYPSDSLQAAEVDMIMDTLDDTYASVTKAGVSGFHNIMGNPMPPEVTKALEEAVLSDGVITTNLKLWEKLLGDKIYFVRDTFSVADLYVFNYFYHRYHVGWSAEHLKGVLPQNAPKLAAFMDRIAQLPKVAAYLNSRPANPTNL